MTISAWRLETRRLKNKKKLQKSRRMFRQYGPLPAACAPRCSAGKVSLYLSIIIVCQPRQPGPRRLGRGENYWKLVTLPPTLSCMTARRYIFLTKHNCSHCTGPDLAIWPIRGAPTIFLTNQKAGKYLTALLWSDITHSLTFLLASGLFSVFQHLIHSCPWDRVVLS